MSVTFNFYSICRNSSGKTEKKVSSTPKYYYFMHEKVTICTFSLFYISIVNFLSEPIAFIFRSYYGKKRIECFIIKNIAKKKEFPPNDWSTPFIKTIHGVQWHNYVPDKISKQFRIIQPTYNNPSSTSSISTPQDLLLSDFLWIHML